jgi:hypothetical protein
MADGADSHPIKHYLKSNPGESTDDFLRRMTTELVPIYNEIGLLEIDKTEYERLSDKQTESQVLLLILKLLK